MVIVATFGLVPHSGSFAHQIRRFSRGSNLTINAAAAGLAAAGLSNGRKNLVPVTGRNEYHLHGFQLVAGQTPAAMLLSSPIPSGSVDERHPPSVTVIGHAHHHQPAARADHRHQRPLPPALLWAPMAGRTSPISGA